MSIKTIQNLVSEAMSEIKTIDAEEAYQMVQNKNCINRHDPFEKYLNEIYSKEICISPIKSLSLHLTNINSSYGLSPLIDYKKLWDENKIND